MYIAHFPNTAVSVTTNTFEFHVHSHVSEHSYVFPCRQCQLLPFVQGNLRCSLVRKEFDFDLFLFVFRYRRTSNAKRKTFSGQTCREAPLSWSLLS